jgi:hypothetical protein
VQCVSVTNQQDSSNTTIRLQSIWQRVGMAGCERRLRTMVANHDASGHGAWQRLRRGLQSAAIFLRGAAIAKASISILRTMVGTMGGDNGRSATTVTTPIRVETITAFAGTWFCGFYSDGQRPASFTDPTQTQHRPNNDRPFFQKRDYVWTTGNIPCHRSRRPCPLRRAARARTAVAPTGRFAVPKAALPLRRPFPCSDSCRRQTAVPRFRRPSNRLQ